jgi:hypothetical protein
MDWEANGPSYLTEHDVEEDAPNTAEEIWHVAIASDDIKTMTLEQLDDALRLDVISGDTQVWKEGMGDWQPLSVVAGMDDDDDAGTQDEPEVLEDEDDEATVMRPFPFPAPGRGAAPRAPNPPPRPPTRAPNPPPRSAVRVPSAPPSRAPSPHPVTLRNASARSAPAPSRPAPAAPVKTQPRMKAMQPSPAAHVFAQPSPAAHVFAPPARSAPPPAMQAFAPPARSAPPRAQAFAPPPRPAAGAPYPAAQGFPQAYPAAQPFPAQPFASSRPPSPMSLPPNADLGFARSMAPAKPFARPRRRRSSGALYFFLPLALFGGLFAAYRNDLLLQAARAVHQERQYLQLERALVGVPGFGTPRSVAASASLTTDTSSEGTTDSTTKTTRDEAPSHAALDTHSAPSQEERTTAPSTAVAKDLAPKAEPKTTETKALPEAPTRQFVESKPAPEPRRAAPEPREKPAPSHVAAAPPVSHPAPTRAEPPPAPKHEVAVASSTKHESHDVKAAKVVLAETSDDAPTPSSRRSKRAAVTASASTKAAASFGSLAAHAEEDEASAPKAKPAPKPKAEPKPKPAAAPAAAPDPVVSSGNSALDEAIRAAAAKKTNKKKPAGADSDPLNGSLD